MTSNGQNDAKSRSHKMSQQSRYQQKLVIDKENVYQENRLPNVSSKLYGQTSTLSVKSTKYSDNISHEQALRSKRLQEVDEGAVPKKPTHSSNKPLSAKPFAQTRFQIYSDNSYKGKDNETNKNLHSKTNDSSRPNYKYSCLRENVKNSAASTRRNKETDEKSSRSDLSNPAAKVSPKNLPHTTQNNVFKIKELHKKSIVAKKPLGVVSDVMSLELAYNVEYMYEFVRFQMEINAKKSLSRNFLKKGVTADQRRLIVKYLISSTAYYKYPSFILYQAVKIFDSYIDTVDVRLNELQVVALAALWISLKKDLNNNDIPEASTIIELAGTAFQGNKQPLIEYEKKVLMSLNFEISFAEPFSMLALYTVLIDEVRTLTSNKVQELYYFGSYLIDLSLLDESMLNIPVVYLAAVCAEIALMLAMSSSENLGNPQWSYWRNQVFKATPIIERYRYYSMSECQMNDVRSKLLLRAVLSEDNTTDFNVVFKKYNTKRYGLVSVIMLRKISLLSL